MNYLLPRQSMQLNTAPMQNALAGYRQGMNQQAQFERQADWRQQDIDWRRQQAGRAQGNADRRFGLAEKRFDANQAHQDRSFGLQKKQFGLSQQRHHLDAETRRETLKRKLVQGFAGVAQRIEQEQDPAKRAQMFRQFLSFDPRVAQNLPRELHNDPIGGARFIMDQARGYQDPLSAQLKRSQIAKISAGSAGLGKPPSGYRFNQDGTLTAIPGGPATKMGSEVAGKVALMFNGLQELPRAREIFKRIGGGGRVNMILNRGQAGEARRIVQTLVEAQLRALTGAAATEQETERLMNFYGPVSTDTVKTMMAKLDRLDSTVRNSIKLMQTGRVSYNDGNRLDALIPKAGAVGPARSSPMTIRSMSTDDLMKRRQELMSNGQ